MTIDPTIDEDGPPGDEKYAAKRRKFSEDHFYGNFYRRDINEFY